MTITAHIDRFAQENLPPRSQWPDLRLAEAGLDYPDQLNATTVLLDDMVRNGHGDAPAIHTLQASCTYYQLLVRVDQVGAACHTGTRTCFEAGGDLGAVVGE